MIPASERRGTGSGPVHPAAPDQPRRLRAAGTGAHEVLIVAGSAYSCKTGKPANLELPWSYPVDAVCKVCGQVVHREEMAIERQDWMHTGRMPGEPR